MSRSVFAANRETFQAIYPGVSQQVSVGTASVQSSAFAAATTIVELFATTDCWIRINDSPTAVNAAGTSFFLGQGMFKYYGIQHPGIDKLAVISNGTSTGSLHIIEGNY